jgi:hypothetical protein
MVKPRKIVGGSGGAGSRSDAAKARLCAGHDGLEIPIGKESRIGGDELQGRRAAMVTTPSPEGNSYRGAHFMEL